MVDNSGMRLRAAVWRAFPCGWIPLQIEQGTNTATVWGFSDSEGFTVAATLKCVHSLHCEAAGIKALTKWLYVENISCSQCDSLFKPTYPACLHDWQLLNKLIQKLTGTQIRQRPTFLPHIGHWQTFSCYNCCFYIWTLVVSERALGPVSCKSWTVTRHVGLEPHFLSGWGTAVCVCECVLLLSLKE